MENIDIKDFQSVASVDKLDNILLALSSGGGAKISVELLTAMLIRDVKPTIKDGLWSIGGVSTSVEATGKTPILRTSSTGIEWQYEGDMTWKLLVSYDVLKLKFSDLTAEQVQVLKLKFSDLSTSEKESLRGAIGAPGKTPIMGVDFWTDADRQAAINGVIDEVLGVDMSALIQSHNTNTTAHSDIRTLIVQYLASSKTYTNEQIAQLIGAAPDMLDTLEEIATAITNNKSVSDTLNAAVVLKLGKEDAKSLYVALQGYVAYSQAEKNKLAGIDMASKQNKSDNTLTTTSKDVVGAINEIKAGIGTSNVLELIFTETYNTTFGGEFSNDAILASGVFTSFEQFDTIHRHLMDGGSVVVVINHVGYAGVTNSESKFYNIPIATIYQKGAELGYETIKQEGVSFSVLQPSIGGSSSTFNFLLYKVLAKITATGEIIHERHLSFSMS